MNNNNLLVLGLDGATWKNLDEFMDNGSMPNLKMLVKNGVSGTLKSTLPPSTPVAWTSFQTGMNPGRHGVFGFMKYYEDYVNPDFYDSDSIKSIRIWELLGRNGLNNLIINMPVSYPLKPIKGTIVSSFMTPKHGVRVYPEDKEQLLKKIGYQIDFTEHNLKGGLPDNMSSQDVLTKNLGISKKRIIAWKELFKEDHYDNSFMLIKATDIMQHYFFGKDILRKFYQKLDTLIGELITVFRENCGKNIIVISDHGFHSEASLQFSPYAWLNTNGYIKTSTEMTFVRNIIFYLKKYGLNYKQFRIIKKIRDIYIRNLEQKSINKMQNQHKINATFEGLYVDGDYSEDQINEIVKQLGKLKYMNRKVFKRVEKSEDIYEGKYLYKAPTIVWMPSREFMLNLSPLESIQFKPFKTSMLGSHLSDRNGIYVFHGDMFKKGKGKTYKIEDIFPLICHIFDIEPPDIDGKLPVEVLKNPPKNAGKYTDNKFVHSMIDKQIEKINE
jgi:predicted AlkP superfamily phosphohydrolase/phosphomutase